MSRKTFTFCVAVRRLIDGNKICRRGKTWYLQVGEDGAVKISYAMAFQAGESTEHTYRNFSLNKEDLQAKDWMIWND